MMPIMKTTDKSGILIADKNKSVLPPLKETPPMPVVERPKSDTPPTSVPKK